MFKIEHSTALAEPSLQLINEKQSKVEILPSKGALLFQISIQNNSSKKQLLTSFSHSDQLSSLKGANGCFMGPFTNRLENSSYLWEGKSYNLTTPLNDGKHALHGFLTFLKFLVLEENIDSAFAQVILETKYQGQNIGFPFPFNFKVFYTLFKNELEIKSQVENTGTTNMPWAQGWHPYFNSENGIANTSLKLNEVVELECNSELIPNQQKLEFQKFKELKKIGDHKFDTGFQFLNKSANTVRFRPISNLEIDLILDSSHNYLQLYIPKEKNCIAIEPMTGAANCFNNSMGLKKLSPREKLETSIKLKWKSI